MGKSCSADALTVCPSVRRGEFRQRVKIVKANPVISGSYEYQVCSDIDGKCIPFDEEFTFTGLSVIDADNQGEVVSSDVDRKDPNPELPVLDQAPTKEDTQVIQKSSVWSQKSPNTPTRVLPTPRTSRMRRKLYRCFPKSITRTGGFAGVNARQYPQASTRPSW